MKKRGQIATEYLILIGIVLVLLVPATILYYRQTQDSRNTTRISEAQNAANTLTKEGERIYYLSESQSVITITLPEGIENIRIEQNEVVIRLTGPRGEQNEVSSLAEVPIASVAGVLFSTMEGTQKIRLVSKNGSVCFTTKDKDC